jgi:uncharacterized protein HemX
MLDVTTAGQISIAIAVAAAALSVGTAFFHFHQQRLDFSNEMTAAMQEMLSRLVLTAEERAQTLARIKTDLSAHRLVAVHAASRETIRLLIEVATIVVSASKTKAQSDFDKEK